MSLAQFETITFEGKRVKIRTLYDSGLPFSEAEAGNVDAWLERVERKFAAGIIIDGGSGKGKTTLAVELANYINGYYTRKGFLIDYDYQLAKGGDEFRKKLIEAHAYNKNNPEDKRIKVVIYDEAGDLGKKSTMSKFNKDLVRTFEMFRGFKIFVIMVLPRFWKIDNDVYDLEVFRALINIDSRTHKQGNYRVYDMQQLNYMRSYWYPKLVEKTKVYDKGMHHWGHFLNLPKKEADRLEKISLDAKEREILQMNEIKQDMVTRNDIAAHFHKSLGWVRNKLKEATPVKQEKVKQVQYYHKDILTNIEKILD